MRNKTAAVEMSVGTIVTIVLLVTFLILGIVLVRNIFTSAKGVVDLTDQQLRSEVNKLFSEESKMSIYPGTRYVEIKQETTDGVGVGIKNLQQGVAGSTTFSYEVKVSDADISAKCGIDASVATSWITTGRAENDIPIASGDTAVQKVLFNIPVGAPLCTIRFRIDVSQGTTIYASDFFDLKVLSK
ncbi:Uncharacterised protein [uncultured archaeon]|nr:Uncharacterised protein [uncultured archaeon]